LRANLLKDAQKAVDKGKRELSTARRKQKSANERLKKARASLKRKPNTDAEKRVKELIQQARELGNTVGAIAKLLADAIERLVPLKTDAIVEGR
jgi:chorismate synthase